ncbi:hypothetical protein HY612_02735 [Candidatus Roizmanbacteria bacterium]|nr:hypothetical protein [Candidatus Roizmanbacteria bacterium]
MLIKRLIIGLGLLSLIIGFLLFQKLNHEPKERHVHAGFQVYVDGKLQDFSEAKYMSLLLCEEENTHPKKTKERIQIEKAHLHHNVGDVVHSEREGAVWGDLFKNIKVEFDRSKRVEGYVNGKKITNIFDYPIKAYDSVVIFSGKIEEKLLKKAVTKKRIKEVEREGAEC